MMQKSIFGNKRPKWPSVYILGHQLAYMGQSIRGLSQFILIGTFSSPNPLSLRLLITCLLTVIDLTEGNGQKSSLGAFCFKVFILASFFFFIFLFIFNPISLCSLGLCMFSQVSFIVLFMFWACLVVRKRFFVHALFSASCFWVRVLEQVPHMHVMSMHMQVSSCVCRYLPRNPNPDSSYCLVCLFHMFYLF